MIPHDYITEWRSQAPWVQDFQVEQDLIISRLPFAVASRWYEGSCNIATYALDELLATKLRALYQRRKGRDLLDLAVALEKQALDPTRTVTAFSTYMDHAGQRVTRAQFEQNLDNKLRDPQFNADIGPLLSTDFAWDIEEAARLVGSQLITRLPGEPWKSGDQSS